MKPFDKLTLPYSTDVERSVLGCLLLDNSTFQQARKLTPDSFHLENHRKAFLAISALIDSGRAADLVTLRQELESRGQLNNGCGPGFVSALTDGQPRLTNIAAYIDILEDKAERRRIIHASFAAATRAADEGQELAAGRATRNGSGFHLVELDALLSEPEERVSWIVKDRLPSAGFSMLVGKPKVGKSTLLRALALAVSRGEKFLTWETVQGPVIYLALEEKRSEVSRHFRDMGATGAEPIFIHAAHAPDQAIAGLRTIVDEHHPVLIIVDPLLKFTRIKDEKAYAETTAALEPLLIIARESGAHLAASYHSSKIEKADPTDSPLGSTGFAAAVDTILYLRRGEKYRTLVTVQRYGHDLPETVLEFDQGRRLPALGAEKGKAEEQRIAETILEFLAGCKEPQTEAQVNEEVEGKTMYKRTALRSLVAQGKVQREGKGGQKDPFRYSCSRCSHTIPGTREQEPENTVHAIENKGQIDVPENLQNSQMTLNSREQDFLSEEEAYSGSF